MNHSNPQITKGELPDKPRNLPPMSMITKTDDWVKFTIRS